MGTENKKIKIEIDLERGKEIANELSDIKKKVEDVENTGKRLSPIIGLFGKEGKLVSTIADMQISKLSELDKKIIETSLTFADQINNAKKMSDGTFIVNPDVINLIDELGTKSNLTASDVTALSEELDRLSNKELKKLEKLKEDSKNEIPFWEIFTRTFVTKDPQLSDDLQILNDGMEAAQLKYDQIQNDVLKAKEIIQKKYLQEQYRIFKAHQDKIKDEITSQSEQTTALEEQNNLRVIQIIKDKAETILEVTGAYAAENTVIDSRKTKIVEAEEAKYDKLIALAKKFKIETTELEEDKVKRIQEINNSFNLDHELRAYKKHERIKEIEEKQAADHKKLLDLQLSEYEYFYANAKQMQENARVVGADGIIDVDGTRKNLQEAAVLMEEHRHQLEVMKAAKEKYYDDELKKLDSDSVEYLALLRDKNSAILDFESKNRDINKQIQDNEKQTADLQKQYWQEVDAKLQEHVGQLSEGVKSLMAGVNAIMQDGLDEAKEKLTLVSEMHNKAVEDRKASDDKLQELENQAANARGGRSLVIQEQIDREMAKNQQLAQQEKNLAKEKEKAEKEIAKKEKQMKKAEMGQNIMMGIANVALSVTKALAAGPFIGQILAGLAAAAGAVQVAVMTKQLSKMEQGGLLRGKRHTQGGMRIEGTNIEVEGGEYVINRESTNKNLGLIRYINSQRRELKPQHINSFFATPAQALPKVYGSHFATGGELPAINNTINIDNAALMDAIRSMKFEPKVAVTDILRVQDDMNKVQTWAGA